MWRTPGCVLMTCSLMFIIILGTPSRERENSGEIGVQTLTIYPKRNLENVNRIPPPPEYLYFSSFLNHPCELQCCWIKFLCSPTYTREMLMPIFSLSLSLYPAFRSCDAILFPLPSKKFSFWRNEKSAADKKVGRL